MAAAAGRLIALKVSGEAVAFTNEATTASANLRYQITNAAKRVWDRSAAVVVKDGGTPVDPVADPYTVNRLTGTITFVAAAVRTITVSSSYLPLSTLASGHGFSFKATVATVEDNVFGDTDVSRQAIQADCSGSIDRFVDIDTYLADAFDAAVPFVLEFSPDGGTTPRLRAWALPTGDTIDGDRVTLFNESFAFVGSADADGRSFTWM